MFNKINKGLLTTGIIILFPSSSTVFADIAYTEPGNMVFEELPAQGPKVTPADTTQAVTDSILAQTSYMARVLMQAHDVFPPSFVSSRSSGETYSSTIVPLEHNLKLLVENSIYRNAFGALAVTSSGPVDNKYDVSRMQRDWVEFHIYKYCDPLAASIGTYGIGNCKAGLEHVPKDPAFIAAERAKGNTRWSLVSEFTKTAQAPNGLQGTHAADLSATSLFASSLTDAEAAIRYVYNVTNAKPSPLSGTSNYEIPDSMVNYVNGVPVLNNKGFDEYMSYMESQSKYSLAQYALMNIVSERMQMNNIKIPVTSWDESGNKVVTYKPTSRQGLLEFEANKRYKDPNWYDQIQQMPTPALLKEIAYMMAMQNTLEFKRYEQQQIQTAIMASLLSSAVDLKTFSTKMQQGQSAQMADQSKQAEEYSKNTISGIGNIANQIVSGLP